MQGFQHVGKREQGPTIGHKDEPAIEPKNMKRFRRDSDGNNNDGLSSGDEDDDDEEEDEEDDEDAKLFNAAKQNTTTGGGGKLGKTESKPVLVKKESTKHPLHIATTPSALKQEETRHHEEKKEPIKHQNTDSTPNVPRDIDSDVEKDGSS